MRVITRNRKFFQNVQILQSNVEFLTAVVVIDMMNLPASAEIYILHKLLL